jgi:hypothetical protein
MPFGLARFGVVTWMIGLELRIRSHSAAALMWLSTAPGPHVFTAASHRPSRVMTLCPTA